MATAVENSKIGNVIATAKVVQIGNSLGVILPKEVLSTLGVGKGDMLHLVEHADGYILTAYEPDFAAKMAVLEEVMRENRDVLRRLAE